ncbi:hypothetical protein LX32DRAFT_261880 [Colletotrichum zoysiae]|uniref:Uncharacterized protein n=1 Tax=Colletotrichum zoysiae TaxID=1216348 RepID=A0AAD9M2F7_9PEZI|nr:hypothetical protein LX32DRAFT_261880 [Colletotrichum zoysiae]
MELVSRVKLFDGSLARSEHKSGPVIGFFFFFLRTSSPSDQSGNRYENVSPDPDVPDHAPGFGSVPHRCVGRVAEQLARAESESVFGRFHLPVSVRHPEEPVPSIYLPSHLRCYLSRRRRDDAVSRSSRTLELAVPSPKCAIPRSTKNVGIVALLGLLLAANAGLGESSDGAFDGEAPDFFHLPTLRAEISLDRYLLLLTKEPGCPVAVSCWKDDPRGGNIG